MEKESEVRGSVRVLEVEDAAILNLGRIWVLQSLRL